MLKPVPPVSVVVPTYNRSTLVGRAVESALAALAEGDEVIVVDDGSSDETEKVLERYAGRLRYVRQPHAGAGRARNRGVREARHPWVAFLDSDDEWLPDRLSLTRRVLEARPDVLFCFTDLAAHRAEGESRRHLATWHRDPRRWDEILGPGVPFSALGPLPPGRADFLVHVGDLYPSLLRSPYVPCQTALVRRDRAGEHLRFAEDLPTYEDWECFARLARHGKAAYLDCETAWQWSHRGPRLTDADRFVRATTRLTLVERVWGADADFLAGHREQYDRIVQDQRLIRARWWIQEGRTAEARRELAQVRQAPASHRLAAALPGPVARGLVSARAWLRSSG
jgi:glycosyltransferase involved in cell wall biosynthesis